MIKEGFSKEVMLELTLGVRGASCLQSPRTEAVLAKRVASDAKAHFRGNSLLGMNLLYGHLYTDPNLRIRMVL